MYSLWNPPPMSERKGPLDNMTSDELKAFSDYLSSPRVKQILEESISSPKFQREVEEATKPFKFKPLTLKDLLFTVD